MIERIFGNFKGTVDPITETVLILGLSYGWKGLYSVDEIPSKIAFYKGLIKQNDTAKGYKDTLACLQWAQRILDDG